MIRGVRLQEAGPGSAGTWEGRWGCQSGVGGELDQPNVGGVVSGFLQTPSAAGSGRGGSAREGEVPRGPGESHCVSAGTGSLSPSPQAAAGSGSVLSAAGSWQPGGDLCTPSPSLPSASPSPSVSPGCTSSPALCVSLPSVSLRCAVSLVPSSRPVHSDGPETSPLSLEDCCWLGWGRWAQSGSAGAGVEQSGTEMGNWGNWQGLPRCVPELSWLWTQSQRKMVEHSEHSPSSASAPASESEVPFETC